MKLSGANTGLESRDLEISTNYPTGHPNIYHNVPLGLINTLLLDPNKRWILGAKQGRGAPESIKILKFNDLCTEI